MTGACAFASLCLFEYGSDKFEESSVCFPLLELSVCFPHTSVLIKCYTVMKMNQRQARDPIKAFHSSVFSLPEVKSYVVLSRR